MFGAMCALCLQELGWQKKNKKEVFLQETESRGAMQLVKGYCVCTDVTGIKGIWPGVWKRPPAGY